jgi:hypothetical protein
MGEIYFLFAAAGLIAFVLCVRLCGEALGKPKRKMIAIALGAGLFAAASAVTLGGFLGYAVL